MPKIVRALVFAAMGLLLVGELGWVRAVEVPAESFTVERPTLIGFFPVTEDELRRSPDTAEAFSDFETYLARAKAPLGRAGIDVKQVRVADFDVRVGNAVRKFHATKNQPGYYLISPQKEARVEYGVSTDDDITAIASDYFGVDVR